MASLIKYPYDLDKFSIHSRLDDNNGYIRFIPKENEIDDYLFSKNLLYSQLMILLSSRASEILVFGEKEIIFFCGIFLL